jgi:hypothetical protein
MSETFELVDIAGDISGKLRLIYGSGPADPASFVLTLTPQYVARALGKTPPASFHEIEKYADDNAGDLREMALLEKGTSLHSRNPQLGVEKIVTRWPSVCLYHCWVRAVHHSLEAAPPIPIHDFTAAGLTTGKPELGAKPPVALAAAPLMSAAPEFAAPDLVPFKRALPRDIARAIDAALVTPTSKRKLAPVVQIQLRESRLYASKSQIEMAAKPFEHRLRKPGRPRRN